MSHFLYTYVPLLLLTLAVEGGLAAVWAPRESRWLCVQASISLNLLTHSLGTLALWHAHAPLLLLESVIVGVEYVGYRGLVRLPVLRAAVLALVANLASAGLAVFFV